MQRISWDEYFMAQSHLLSLRSTCSRLSVGATIVKDKRIVSGGYNGSIKGDEHCIDVGCKVVEGHCVRTIHANDYRNNEYARELLEKSGVIIRKIDYDVNNVIERLLNNK